MVQSCDHLILNVGLATKSSPIEVSGNTHSKAAIYQIIPN